MTVVDASALLDLLLKTERAERTERRLFRRNATLHAPHLIDLEILQVLRRYWRRGLLTDERADETLSVLAAFPITRYSHLLLASRIWQLRNNLTAYDASYVALAEFLEATLVTTDRALAASSGHSARIELIS